jgi:hypothetical protein
VLDTLAIPIKCFRGTATSIKNNRDEPSSSAANLKERVNGIISSARGQKLGLKTAKPMTTAGKSKAKTR